MGHISRSIPMAAAFIYVTLRAFFIEAHTCHTCRKVSFVRCIVFKKKKIKFVIILIHCHIFDMLKIIDAIFDIILALCCHQLFRLPFYVSSSPSPLPLRDRCMKNHFYMKRDNQPLKNKHNNC